LYKYLGPSVFYGIAVLLLTIPTNSLTLRILNRLSKKEFEAKDARTKKTSEAVSNMKLLKLQGWEKHFRKGIEVQRKEELKRHINRGAFRALNNAISNAVPAIVLVVTLTAYRRTGKPIVASTIFTAISLFNQLRFPLLFYPMVVDSLANGKNSIKRLSSYLCQEELTPYVQRFSKGPEEGGGIQLKNGNFLWSSATKSSDGEHDSVIAAPALCGAELNVNSGEIVAVVGPVGSGKSALIKSLLGELEPTPRIMVDEIGTTMNTSVNDIPVVKTKGNVAYCAQESWLSKGTIRDAVLFGRDYDEEKYLTALYDAGLDEDFARGSLSHDTQVGEGGSSLSGGQRARVQLARALYDENTGVYLLDDPLSALDAAVGATVFERVTARIRQRKAAAVFVTNDASLPRRCDRVVLMGSSGSQSCSKIVDTGSYDELLSRGHDCGTNFAHEFDDDSKQQRNKTEIDPIITQHADIEVQVVMEHDAECLAERKIPPLSMEAFNDNNGNNNTVSHTSSKEQDDSQTNRISSTEKSKEVGSLDERMSTGAVPFKTYMTYLNSVRKPLLILATMGCFLMANGAQFYQQLTVAKWTELSHSSTMSSALSGRYLQTLVNAAGVVSIFLWLRSYLLMRVGTRSSEHLHNKMLHSVFNAPSTFFDSTPSGQILSRFGSELGIVDNSVPDGIGSVLYCFLNIFITVLGLAGVVTPKITLPVVFIGIFYKMIMAKFRPAARDLKRCESKTRSPIYTHFGETLRGVETIRSYPGSSLLWSSNLRNLVDTNLSVFTSVKHLDRWLSIRLESLGNAVVLMAAFASVILTRSGKLKAGSAGWGLTQSLAITGLLTWAVRTLTDLESQMMSVMRVTELTNIDSTTSSNKKIPLKIPQEYEAPGDAINTLFNNNGALLPTAPSQDRALIQSGWPWKGEISFNNASMRYNSASELALKNVTLTVPAGTTLGIVGRTGSGKSSLLLTLFRLIEIEKGGAILIDGVDIRSISLQTLRNTLSIIPQDPTLFSGTLMYNLDATMKSKPEDAWLALEAASPDLANEFRRSGLGLDTMIEEGGTNYSAGQRQLICLARALLRRSKILVLDEATSSVDPNTDAQVQETIRKEFVDKGVSVITVAHRLDTVMGSDKIAVLGDGELIEYGHPEELLLNRDGHLRRLVDADTENKRKGAVVSSNSESMEKVAV
jgi:ATP-binding cassette subfamily C (CFTR/MRP) protein 1